MSTTEPEQATPRADPVRIMTETRNESWNTSSRQRTTRRTVLVNSYQQVMEFNTILNRSCPNGGYFTSSKQHENSDDVKKLGQHRERRRPGRARPENWKKQPCHYCGLTGNHPEGKNCPAYGKRCSQCQRFNHFAAVCSAGGKDRKQKHEQKQPGKAGEKRHVKKNH